MFAARELIIPASVRIVCENAFCDCDTIKHITISNPQAYINDYAFAKCNSLETILTDPFAHVTYGVPGQP